MIIGWFEYNAKRDTYLGEVIFLNDRKVWLLPSPEWKNGPHYGIYTCVDLGNVGIGSGWKRTTPEGWPHVEILIDVPMLPNLVHAKLSLREDGKLAALTWKRPGSGSS